MAAKTTAVESLKVTVGDNKAVVSFDGEKFTLSPAQVHDLRRALDRAFLELH